jgi:hypothetical protein
MNLQSVLEVKNVSANNLMYNIQSEQVWCDICVTLLTVSCRIPSLIHN